MPIFWKIAFISCKVVIWLFTYAAWAYNWRKKDKEAICLTVFCEKGNWRNGCNNDWIIVLPIFVKKGNPALPSIHRKQDAGFFLLIRHIYKYLPWFHRKKLHLYFLSSVVGPAPLSRWFVALFAFGFLWVNNHKMKWKYCAFAGFSYLCKEDGCWLIVDW